MEQINEPTIFKKEVDIVITAQARRILSESTHDEEEFKDWALKDQKISLGGNNIALFLEAMHLKDAAEALKLQQAKEAAKYLEEHKDQ